MISPIDPQLNFVPKRPPNFDVLFANAAHAEAQKQFLSAPNLKGEKLLVFDFSAFQIMLADAMVKGANLYRAELVKTGLIPE